jgi:tRNA pseudouridine32 synthase/23S rRNA pseudouridine746 synthase
MSKLSKPNKKRQAKGSAQHQAALKSRGPKRPPAQKTRYQRIDETETAFAPEDEVRIKSMILYEDVHLIAFHKPSGLSSQGGRGHEKNIDDLLGVFQKSNGKRPRLIHRLDRDTSGLLIAAKTHPDAAFFGKAMAERRFEKTYQALVSPSAQIKDEGLVEASLRRDDIGREAYSRICNSDHPDAQDALTHYRVLQRFDEAIWLEVKPRTGRMHQIRVHMAHLGAPLLGDVRYGGALRLGCGTVGRLMLHALKLRFPHPQHESIELSCPLAIDMEAFIRVLNEKT